MSETSDNASVLLSLRDLCVGSLSQTLVANVSFELRSEQVVGLVGESGSGKTLTSRSLSGLLPRSVEVQSGSLLFRGAAQANTSEGWPSLRGEIATIFQEPRLALNPVRTIEAQASLVLKETGVKRSSERRSLLHGLLTRVGIRDPERVAGSFPWELSGGMCQRVMVALVLARRPSVIVADEPTSNLDASVRNRVMDVILRTREEIGATLLLISHDLPLLTNVCDRIYVMQGGSIVDSGTPDSLHLETAHPYTRFLLNVRSTLIARTREIESRR